MRSLVSVSLAALWLAPSVFGQSTILTRPDPINLRPPAINDNGLTVFFAGAIKTDSAAQPDTATNLNRWIRQPSAAIIDRLTNYVSDAPYAGVASVSYPGTGDLVVYTALPDGAGGREEVHVISLFNHTDRVLATDDEGCAQPLCPDCYRTCLRSVHLSQDGATALYEAARNEPFYTVQTDQSGKQHLATYQGTLAPSPQRVIADGGTVVFTSAAPHGPTFAAAATDVYLMDIDGTNVRQVTDFGDAQFIASDAVISKNGSAIAFASNFSDAGVVPSQIFVVKADGSGLRRVSLGSDPATSPSISADGLLITYVQSGQIKRAPGLVEPPLLTIAQPVSLTDLSTSAPASPVISDDGAQVAFTLGPTFGKPAAVYRADTSETDRNLRQLTPIYTPRVLFSGGVVSVASSAAASPGSLISVYGANLGLDELTIAPGFPLPTQLKEVSLLVNDQPIPIHSTTPWQINAHLPQTIEPGMPGFKVHFDNGVAISAINAEVKARAPENFFVPATSNGQSYQQADALHAGTLIFADADHPAHAGEILEIYGLGLGVTRPMVPAGEASPSMPPAEAQTTPELTIGGRTASITFAGLIPGLAGVYQVNAVVPSGLLPGLHTLSWKQPDGSTISSSSIFVE